jgi:hypothetical protein
MPTSRDPQRTRALGDSLSLKERGVSVAAAG